MAVLGDCPGRSRRPDILRNKEGTTPPGPLYTIQAQLDQSPCYPRMMEALSYIKLSSYSYFRCGKAAFESGCASTFLLMSPNVYLGCLKSQEKASLMIRGLQACEDVVGLIGSLLEVPDKSGNRGSVLKRLETISIKQGLKAAVAVGVAYHTSCRSSK